MSWSGVKKQSYKQEIKSWCEKMGIENYNINSQCEIDVGGSVDLRYNDLEELPYKFGEIKGYFDIGSNRNLISLKNCPNEVGSMFDISGCSQLDSLEGCPKEMKGNFWCMNCKRKFTIEEIQSLCEVKGYIYIYN